MSWVPHQKRADNGRRTIELVTSVSCRASRGYTLLTVFNVARTDATPPLQRQSSYHLDTYHTSRNFLTKGKKKDLYSTSLKLIKKQMNTLLYPFVSNTFKNVSPCDKSHDDSNNTRRTQCVANTIHNSVANVFCCIPQYKWENLFIYLSLWI